MKKYLLFIVIAISVSSCSDGTKPDYSKEMPPLQHRVNDYADLFEQETRDSLETKLARYEEETSTQIVILTVEDIGEKSIEEYSIAVAENWKTGQRGKDNGVLITVAKTQKKVRIETGYGIEGVLPDGQCWYIIEHVFLPNVKKEDKDFDTAINTTVDAIIKSLAGEFSNLQKSIEQEEADEANKITFIVILFFATAFIGAIGAAMENGFVSGGIGAVVYPATYAYFWSAELFTILILVGIGFLVCLFARFMIEAAGESSGGSGGYSFGGSSGGDSGGFSGGCGGFGGGGASGGW